MSKDNTTAAMLMAIIAIIIASIQQSSNIIFVIISTCLPFWQRELSGKTYTIGLKHQTLTLMGATRPASEF